MKTHSKFLVALLLIGLISLPLSAWASVAGYAQFVNGDVRVTNSAGQSRQLQKGDAVSEGDTLISAVAATAQIKMEDGGIIAVRPDTRIKFDQFVFAGKQDGSERGFFSLFKGGFRAVTGLIGRVNKKNYKIKTPSATIGIRGTDHETFVVLPGSPLAAIAPSGAYNKVNVGETTMTTDKGTISVLPNQMGYAGGMDQQPKLQPINTNLFAAAAEAKANGAEEGEAVRESAVVDNAAQEPMAGSEETTDAFGNALKPNLALPFDPLSVIPNLNAVPMPAQGQGAIAYFDTAANGTPYTAGDTMSFTSDRLGMNLTGFTMQGVGLSGSRGAALVVDAGRVSLNGGIETMSWGRWAGTAFSVGPVGSAAMPAADLHFIGGHLVGGMPAANPITGGATASYAAVGGTVPTDVNGIAGQFTGATVGVNFATQQIAVTLNLNQGGVAYSATGGGSYLANGVIPKTVFATVTDSLATGAAAGEYSGAFVGTNAAGLGLVYHINHGNVDIIGAHGFIRQ